MSTNAIMLEMQKKKASHVLHLLLTLLTGGIWAIVWILCAVANHSHNKAIDRKIVAVLAEEGRV